MLPSKEIEDFALRGLNALLAKYDFLSVAAAPRFIYLLSPVNKKYETPQLSSYSVVIIAAKILLAENISLVYSFQFFFKDV